MDGIDGVMPLADLKRMAHVKRWQIVQTSREQTLMEHSGLVALYAQNLLHRLVKPSYIRDELERDVLLWALIHDAPEVYTGDICALSKDAIGPEGLEGLKALEDSTGLEYKRLNGDMSGDFIVKGVVKLADLLEACVFLRTQWVGGHPTSHYAEVVTGLQNKLERHAVAFLIDLELNGAALIPIQAVEHLEFTYRRWIAAILQEAQQ